jgi:hypothetical protein
MLEVLLQCAAEVCLHFVYPVLVAVFIHLTIHRIDRN